MREFSRSTGWSSEQKEFCRRIEKMARGPCDRRTRSGTDMSNSAQKARSREPIVPKLTIDRELSTQRGRSPAVNADSQLRSRPGAEAVAIDCLHIRIESQAWPWWH